MSDEDSGGRGNLKKTSDPLEGEITDHGTVTRAQATIEVAAVEEMLAQVGDDPNMKSWLAYRLYVSGDYERAAEVYEELAESGHQVGETLLHLGAVYLKMDRQGDARAAWERVIEAAPNSRDATKAQSRILKMGRGEGPSTVPPPPEDEG